MWLQLRMYLLLAVMFAIVYAVIVMVASTLGIGNFIVYGVMAAAMIFIQYLIGPALVGWTMKVRWVTEQ